MANASPRYALQGTRRAQVDDVHLTPGGEPVELTNDQIERLKATGVTVKKVTV